MTMFCPRHMGRAALALLVCSLAAPAYAQESETSDRATARSAGKGARGVRGRVVDAETGEPLVGAEVTVLGGSDSATTDGEGQFRLLLPKGRYQIRVYYPLYEGKRLKNVVVTSGLLRVKVTLRTSSDAIEEVVVLAEPQKQTEKGVLELRRRSSGVSDALSAQEISRTPDSSASDAVKRVVSASVVDGRYVYIRGLGDRYVTTLLNGVVLPSPEPDRQAVPLDMFPTALLANLTISKSYSATQPGEFGGGTLSISTNSYPDDFTVKVKASTSGNSEATGQSQKNYSGGSLDLIGFDDGTRSLPGIVPRDRPADPAAGYSRSAMEQIGRSFPNEWAVSERTAVPNLGLGLTIGDTVKPGGKKLGYLATLKYSHKLSVREVDVGKVMLVDNDNFQYREQAQTIRGAQKAQLGGLLAGGYELSKNHNLDFFTLYTHTGISTAQNTTGFSVTDGMAIDVSRLRFQERSLSFSQLQTRHRFPDSGGAELKWQANVAVTTATEPDTRDMTYEVLPDGRERFRNESGSGERFFSAMDELSLGTGLEIKAPLENWLRTTAGVTAQHAKRDFSARQFRYTFVGNNPMTLFAPAEQIFRPENIGSQFLLREETQRSDAYTAERQVYAAFGSAEFQVTQDLRLTSGLRFEGSRQAVASGSRFAVGADMAPEQVTRTDAEFLPSVSSVYALTQSMNLRAAYSRTLARPRFRELAEFIFYDYTRRRNVSGNPDLVATQIHNVDLRWEWFFGETDLLAVSGFYKDFSDPIEMVIYQADNGDVQPVNTAGATVKGIEFEARTGLGGLHDALEDVRAWGNLSLIDSKISLREDQIRSQTNPERPLQGQSPYVLNLGLGYSRDESGTDLSLLYNVFGRRLSEVGFNRLPDVYERPVHRLDAAASQRLSEELSLKLALINLLNQSVEQEQGGLVVESYRPGVTFSLSLSWTP